jgi:hypothetical protein
MLPPGSWSRAGSRALPGRLLVRQLRREGTSPPLCGIRIARHQVRVLCHPLVYSTVHRYQQPVCFVLLRSALSNIMRAAVAGQRPGRDFAGLVLCPVPETPPPCEHRRPFVLVKCQQPALVTHQPAAERKRFRFPSAGGGKKKRAGGGKKKERHWGNLRAAAKSFSAWLSARRSTSPTPESAKIEEMRRSPRAYLHGRILT